MRPPRLAERLARLSLPTPERVYVLGDLEEEFRVRATRDAREARRWYWRQVVLSFPRNALRRFGSRSPAARRHGGDGALGRLVRDARFAWRQAVAQPGRALVLVATIALGTGTNLAFFAVVHAVVLRPLPYPQSDRLVRLWDRHEETGLDYFSVSVPHYVAWTDRVPALAAVGAWREDGFSLAAPDGARPVAGVRMTATLFDVLGVQPARGRAFRSDEDVPGAPAVAVATHGFWLRELGGDPDAVGRPLTVNGEPRILVGVMPDGFVFPQQEHAELLVPYALTDDAENRMAHFLRVLGRLADGTTPDLLLGQLDAVARQLEADDPEFETGWTVTTLGLHEEIVGEVRGTLLLLQAAGLLVLVIAVVNVANLLLVRAADRGREMAVRAALGAGTGRLTQQLLTESVLLGAVGTTAGLALAWAAVAGSRAWLPAALPRQAELALDATTVFAAAALAVLCGVLFGLGPALATATRRGLTSAIGHARAVAPGRFGLRRVLVAGQLAIAVLLITSATLLLQAAVRLARTDVGFEPAGVVTFDLSPQGEAYATPEDRARLYARIEESSRALPGVVEAGLTHRLPLAGNSWFGYRIVGRDGPPDGYSSNWRAVSGGYFASMGIPMARGRTFTAEESWQRGGAVVVNEAAARAFWGDDDPIGDRIVVGTATESLEVIGVAVDSRESGLTAPVEPAAYIPYIAAPVPATTIVVRAVGPPGPLGRLLTAEVDRLDPSLAVANLGTLDAFLAGLQAQPRFSSALATAFGAVALLLAVVGVSGVVGCVVVARSREFTVRLALGARPGHITRRVVADGLLMALAGVAVGLGASFPAARLLATLPFGVEPAGTATLAAVAGVLLAATLLATLAPARRVLRLDPVRALRE